jgi:hypothetical protein
MCLRLILARPARSVGRTSRLRRGGEEWLPGLVVVVIVIIIVVVIDGAQPAGS